MVKATVLVIDDQPGIRRLLTEVLAEEGYAVYTSANGYEGIAMAKEIKPALTLMDMKMPGMDGIETLREMKRLGLGEKVLMMTAYGELDLVNQAREMGAYGYITKPFDIIALCQMIREIAGSADSRRLMIG
ncbi:response regulator [Sporolituus thermophilus]|uniref:Two-component system, response regulator, stage 0 sporulation protein F n=1 Tax=Sporolituus thermophilus DSM 23256 TaxID=1123285 RepID=A0A1G7IUB3_9FIRM|nr:response regulator [Sporolituus thermophilus]SDF16332.1 two-component system, response regulator, stage 0 sporulation protein F [Sporolituus thermophilus DSM 23256]